jgi:hypothetical protein
MCGHPYKQDFLIFNRKMTPETEIFQRCTYVIPKKKRSCRMLVKSGNLYCGEHAIFDPINKVFLK